MLKNPDILILDEATSALDAESETLVNQALAQLLRGDNTTISIAHRLSTIKRSDWIIVISNDGKIAEQGTFAELSSREGAFSKLMEWQLSGGESGTDPGQSRKHIYTPEITEREELEARLEENPDAEGEQSVDSKGGPEEVEAAVVESTKKTG